MQLRGLCQTLFFFSSLFVVQRWHSRCRRKISNAQNKFFNITKKKENIVFEILNIFHFFLRVENFILFDAKDVMCTFSSVQQYETQFWTHSRTRRWFSPTIFLPFNAWHYRSRIISFSTLIRYNIWFYNWFIYTMQMNMIKWDFELCTYITVRNINLAVLV